MAAARKRVLVVDDDASIRLSLLTGRDTGGADRAVLEKPFELDALVAALASLAGPAAIGRLPTG